MSHSDIRTRSRPYSRLSRRCLSCDRCGSRGIGCLIMRVQTSQFVVHISIQHIASTETTPPPQGQAAAAVAALITTGRKHLHTQAFAACLKEIRCHGANHLRPLRCCCQHPRCLKKKRPSGQLLCCHHHLVDLIVLQTMMAKKKMKVVRAALICLPDLTAKFHLLKCQNGCLKLHRRRRCHQRMRRTEQTPSTSLNGLAQHCHHRSRLPRLWKCRIHLANRFSGLL